MFHFVPRKVFQRPRPSLSAPDTPVPGPSSAPPGRPLTPHEAAQHPGTDANKAKRKNKATQGPSDEDIATLLTLSLSDHALWIDVDLRRAISTADDGWIPLSYLVQHSTYLLHLDQRPPDSVLVRAIRGHAEDVLEVRVRVTAPSKDAWYGKDPSASKDDAYGGGYEIRLKHTPDALARVRNSARNEWEDRSVYVENVPIAHRALAGIHRFLSSLLPVAVPTPCAPASTGTGPPPPPPSRIQTVTLPAHHLDRPGAPPKCKGFALVTFASAADATRLATAWPWLPRRTSVPVPVPDEDEDEGEGEENEEGKKRKGKGNDAAEDAVKFGFRALPKARWDALKDEYLEHRQRLLDEIARADAGRPRTVASAAAAAAAPPSEARQPRERSREGRAAVTAPKRKAEGASSAELDPGAPYPPGCLVFVRNVHPETNKTTLKALLGAHAPPVAAAAALDYVDYSKGLASCHVRASTPAHARALVAALAARPLAQAHALDGAGSPLDCPPSLSSSPSPSPSPSLSADKDKDKDNSGPNAHPKRITAELVGGEREALYWAKVPERVRREAVRKAVALSLSLSLSGSGSGSGSGGGADVDGVEEERIEFEGEAAKEAKEGEGGARRRPRKRRRKV